MHYGRVGALYCFQKRIELSKAYMHPNLAWSGIRVDTTSKLGILSFGPQIICALFQCTQLAPEIKTSSNSLRKYILRLNILIIFFGAHFMQYLDIYVYFRHNMSCNCSPEYRFFLLISSLLFSSLGLVFSSSLTLFCPIWLVCYCLHIQSHVPRLWLSVILHLSNSFKLCVPIGR